ncbi:hypothetical protein D3C81_2053770 [compost metagenome]
MHAEAGKAEVLQVMRGEFVGAVIEGARIKWNLAGALANDFIDTYRAFELASLVEEGQLER